MTERIVFPEEPIRATHAHHFDGSHGCADHFHIELHHDGCKHPDSGHLIDFDSECDFIRDEHGIVRKMQG